ncbi:MAG: MFS transporter [Lacunisphaera sp.]|nr:MFS transporter [Lacunisphaera sp.]
MPPPDPSARRKWELLAWLFATFFLYYGDRAIYGVLLGMISGSLQLSPRELGLSNTLMFGAIALLMPLAGYVGDNFNRKRVIVFSLTAWSLGTVLTGASAGLISLILFRSLLTGCGESFYTPAAYSLLAERHRESRGRAMAIHQAALYFGVIASGVAGGWVAMQWGWRWAFFVFGGTGLLLAAMLAWRLETDAPRTNHRGVLGTVRAGLAELAGNPAARVFCLCFAVIVCIVNAYITWAPRLLETKYGLTARAAGAQSMTGHHVAALLAVIAGGYLSDRLARGWPGARITLMLTAMIAIAPCLWWLGGAGSLWSVSAAMVALGLARGAYECNTHVSLFDVVPAELRAVVVSVFAMIALLVGSITPWVFGWLAEQYGISDGLSLGFKGLAGLAVLAAAALARVLLNSRKLPQ